MKVKIKVPELTKDWIFDQMTLDCTKIIFWRMGEKGTGNGEYLTIELPPKVGKAIAVVCQRYEKAGADEIKDKFKELIK